MKRRILNFRSAIKASAHISITHISIIVSSPDTRVLPVLSPTKKEGTSTETCSRPVTVYCMACKRNTSAV